MDLICLNKSRHKSIVLLGDSSVGKSCLVNRIKFGTFDENISPTIGVEIFYINGYKVITISGEPRFKFLADIFITDSTHILIVYDVTNKKSFENALILAKNYKKAILIGNKYDLNSEIPEEELTVPVTYVSAKTGYNISKINMLLEESNACCKVM